MELVRYGHTDQCIGCQHARFGLKPADHREECRARIVRTFYRYSRSISQRSSLSQLAIGWTEQTCNEWDELHLCAPEKESVIWSAHVSPFVALLLAVYHGHITFLVHCSFYHDTRTRSTIWTTRSPPRTPSSSCTSPRSPSRQAAPSRITLA